MSNPPVIKYPLDLTGAAAGNLVQGEVHDLSNLSAKAFVLDYGPFYTRNLVVKSLIDGSTLRPASIGSTNGQYVCTQLFTDMTLRTGLDICSVIVITDKTLPVNLQVSVDYQVLGGEYSASVDAIQQLIDSLELGNQPVKWTDILGRPVQFPPAPHYHDLGDVYGFEYIVAALERITQAIYVGDSAQLAAIYQYIDHEIASVQGDIATNAANLTAHLADFTNPHRVTAAQVGLGNVSNYATASNADGQTGTSTQLFMTPAATTAAIAFQVGNALNAHIANVNNPHATTKAQVGLGSVQNYGIASTAMAQAGTDNASYMTPALTAAAVTQQALGPLNAHINNVSNPHQVTKAQVGLGSVNNYATATNADGQAGTSGALYMTPAATAAAIQSQVLNAFNAHVNNHSNPHVVTAAQVGAYTTAQVDASVNNLQNQINSLNANKQNNLGFTPVQQGGGANQLGNKIYIGHSSGGPRLQVDSTDFGPFSFQGHQHNESDIVGLVGDLNNRPTTAQVQAMINASVSGTFSASGAQENGFAQAGHVIFQFGAMNAPYSNQYHTIYYATPFPNNSLWFGTQIIDSTGQRSTDNIVIQNLTDRRTGMNVHNAQAEGVYLWMAVGY